MSVISIARDSIMLLLFLLADSSRSVVGSRRATEMIDSLVVSVNTSYIAIWIVS